MPNQPASTSDRPAGGRIHGGIRLPEDGPGWSGGLGARLLGFQWPVGLFIGLGEEVVGAGVVRGNGGGSFELCGGLLHLAQGDEQPAKAKQTLEVGRILCQ